MRHASRHARPPIELRDAIATHFKPGHAALRDAGAPLDLMRPDTPPPAQIPRIASAGVALTPYHRNETYSATEPRRRLQKNLHDPAGGGCARGAGGPAQGGDGTSARSRAPSAARWAITGS